MVVKLPDKNILYENIRYYKIKIIRSEDEGEKALLHAAIGRAQARIDRIETDEATKR